MEWSGCRVGENQLCEGCREEGGLFVKLAIIKLSKFRILNFEAFFFTRTDQHERFGELVHQEKFTAWKKV